ncbi:polymorphic toxin type 15 domain-containing protein [Labrys neptuniae]|uniref:Polymorphic toxin type 15 domain-containing protein n=1 Tax=Labrys neptuniae TaxID=376174 RepID=A0ABV3PYY4_9HYPH
MSGALDTALGWGGSMVGGAGGGALGTMLCGPICGYIGRAIGSKAGEMAGRAAAGWIATQMEQADTNADSKTKAEARAKPCETCTKIECFEPPKGSDEKQRADFEKQLKDQQKAINEIPPDKLLDNMAKYGQVKRGPGDARARQDIRDQYVDNRTRDLTRDYLKQGTPNAAEEAAKEAAREASTLDALHTPDLSVGGDGTFSPDNGGMGDRSNNRSIGSQWGKKGRRNALKEHAEDAKKQGKKTNVTLEVCPENGSKSGDPSSKPVKPSDPLELVPDPGQGTGDYMS